MRFIQKAFPMGAESHTFLIEKSGALAVAGASDFCELCVWEGISRQAWP